MVIMMTKDINVVLIDFPNTKTRESVTENEDGSFTVFINSRLSSNMQLEAYQHALRHIEENDFEKADVQVIEAVAHQKVEAPTAPVPVKVKRKRRNRYGKYLMEKRRLEKELAEHGINVDHFAIAERQYLYGGL